MHKIQSCESRNNKWSQLRNSKSNRLSSINASNLDLDINEADVKAEDKGKTLRLKEITQSNEFIILRSESTYQQRSEVNASEPKGQFRRNNSNSEFNGKGSIKTGPLAALQALQ
jgi:hypothetical protein